MLTLSNKIIKYSFSDCQQCGICEAICPKQAISMSFRKDGLHSVEIDEKKCITCGKCVKSCPANKEHSYKGYFDAFVEKKYYLGYNKDNQIRRESSSGGVCKTLIIDALKNGIVDGVYSLRRTDLFPFAEGEFYTKENLPTFDTMPNSVYHSVMACSQITKIKKCKRIMLVGTACQLRAINSIIKTKCEEVIRVCIFCKQQKTLDSTRFLAKVMGTKIPENLQFRTRYRGDGWPGIVRIDEFELPWNRAAQIPFGKRLWTVPGCNICGDSFGQEAGSDISLMDPWEIKQSNEFGETLVIVHTSRGEILLKNSNNLLLEKKSFEDVKPALSLKDVWRKQKTEVAFRGKPCNSKYYRAIKAELIQRLILKKIVEILPRLPILVYRLLAKTPDLRNKILE